MRVCSVNVGTMKGRSREIVNMLARRKVMVCCAQEVQYKGEDKYKLWWSGETDRAGGVGVLVREERMGDVVEVSRVTPRIMKIKMVLGKMLVQIYSVYAPQVGRPQEEKDDFWGKLDDELENIPRADGLILAGDLNGHVGVEDGGYEDVMGKHGIGTRNREGERILEFCHGRDVVIQNTMFKKDREKKITYKSGGAETQVDYIMLKRHREMKVKDCKVIPGEACIPQHRMLVADVVVTSSCEGGFRKKGRKKLKTWKL